MKTHFISIWRARRSRDTYVGFHSHNYYELVYYVKGNGKTIIAGKEYEFKNNCFVIIPPYVNHNEFHNINCEVICLGFYSDADSFSIFNVDNSVKVYRILEEILTETAIQDYLFKDMTETKLRELCIFITRTSSKKASGEKSFEYIINYLNENFHEKIILNDCAKQLNISYDYFQHKFKKKTGNSPKQFLINRRLDFSKELLLKSELNCTEIAYRCGFSTSAQFSKLFKESYKISPSEYKKLNQEKR